MSGRIITISPRQTYTVAVTASGNPVQVPIGQRVYNSIEVVSGTLSVRVSAGGSFPTGASVGVFVGNTFLTNEEPNVIFAPPTSVSALAHVTIPATDSTGWPFLYTNGWSGGTGAMLSVMMTFTPGSASGNIILVAGVELILRDA